jgi:hypothetical protein
MWLKAKVIRWRPHRCSSTIGHRSSSHHPRNVPASSRHVNAIRFYQVSFPKIEFYVHASGLEGHGVLTIRSYKGNLLMSSLVSFGRFPSTAFMTFPMPLSPIGGTLWYGL